MIINMPRENGWLGPEELRAQKESFFPGSQYSRRLCRGGRGIFGKMKESVLFFVKDEIKQMDKYYNQWS